MCISKVLFKKKKPLREGGKEEGREGRKKGGREERRKKV